MQNNRKYVVGGMVLGIALMLLGSFAFEALTDSTFLGGGKDAPGSKAVEEKVEGIASLIHEQYLYEVDDEKLVNGMYAGLLNGVEDPYSCYYTKEEYRIVNESVEGEYQGIGIVMVQEKETGMISVGHCYEGSPAEKAGIQDGDIFYQVEDLVVDKDTTLEDISALIREESRKSVHITLIREGEDDYVELDVTKEAVEIPVVESKMLEDQRGYIAIRQFAATTPDQFQKAYNELQEQKMEALVIDLRDNPGGLLTSVCDTLEMIMPKGLLVYTKDKKGVEEQYDCKGKTPIDIPLVVLINGNSASASEIFAGAVKDHDVGTLVGETSYGKGIVQNIFQLNDGSVVKLTVSSYYTPDGVNIHGKGIAPDEEVKPKEQDEKGQEGKDTQLEKAIALLNN